MIFMYPAMTSRNVDPMLAVSICNLLEAYYLEVIVNAFVSKRLKIKIVENKSGELSEPLLEGAKYRQDKLKDIRGWKNLKTTIQRRIDTTQEAINREQSKKIQDQDQMKIQDLRGHIISDRSEISRIDSKISELENDIIMDRAKEEASKIKSAEERDRLKQNHDRNKKAIEIKASEEDKKFKERQEELRRNAKDADRKFKEKQSEVDRKFKEKQSEVDRKFKEKQEDLKRKDEKFKERSQISTYEPISMKDINLNPAATIINSLEMTIQRSERKKWKKWKHKLEIVRRPLPVGVQIIPQSTDYDKLEKILLHDYYSKFWRSRITRMWRWVKRSYIGKGLRVLKSIYNFIKLVTLNEPDSSGKLNPLDEFNKFGTSYLDASSFKYNRKNSQYHVGSALVLFNLTDLTDNHYDFIGDGVNAFKKMFKMGWNSFVFIDEPNQVFYFISKFDNGLIKTMPFNLLFKATKNYDVFKDIDSLSKFTQPFNRRPKPFKTFLDGIIKKAKINKHINSKLKKFQA